MTMNDIMRSSVFKILIYLNIGFPDFNWIIKIGKLKI